MIGRKNLRVLVVDDTIVYRKAVSDIIEEIPGVELAGVAHNGKIALVEDQASSNRISLRWILKCRK